MAITREQIEALEQFFLAAQIPEKMKLNSAVTLNNVAGNINDKINMLRGEVLTDKVAEAFYNQLVDIKNKLSSN